MKQRYYLLDTNIIAHLAELRAGGTDPDSEALKRHLNKIPKDTRFFLCPITIGEVECGVRVDYADPKKTILARELLSAFSCLDIDANMARYYYAELRARLFNHYSPRGSDNRKKKRMSEWKDPTTSVQLQIDENDLWITGVAMAHNLILVTRDNMAAIKSVAGDDVLFENWLE